MRLSRQNIFALITLTSVALLALGTTVIAGWLLDMPELVQLHPDFVPMQFNTALGFILIACGNLCAIKGVRSVQVVIAVSLIGLGTSTLFEYIAGVNLGIDELFIEHYITTQSSHPGRMAPNTAMCFTLCGLLIYLSGHNLRSERRNLVVRSLHVMILTLSALALLGYFSGVEAGYGWAHLTRMALHTSAGFALIGVTGILINLSYTRLHPASEQAFWLAAGAALTVWIITAGSASSLQRNEVQALADLLQTQAEKMTDTLQADLAAGPRAVVRMVARWRLAGGTAEDLWRQDVKNLLSDVPSLVAVGEVNAQARLTWFEGEERSRLELSAMLKDSLQNGAQPPAQGLARHTNSGSADGLTLTVVNLSPEEGYLGALSSVRKSAQTAAQKLPPEFALRVNLDGQSVYDDEAEADLRWSEELATDLGEQTLTVIVRPSHELVREQFTLQPLLLMLGGMAVSLLLAYAVFSSRISARQARLMQYQTERLAQQERQHRAVLNTMADGLLTLDRNGKITSFNPSCERMFGMGEEQVLGHSITQLIPKYPPISDLKEQRGTFEAVHSQGRTFPTELVVTRIEIAESDTRVATIRDVSREQQEANRINILKTVAEVANRATTTEELMTSVLNTVCETTGWPIGHYWVVENNTAVSSCQWYASSTIREGENQVDFNTFKTMSEQSRFVSGEGAPGKMIESREMMWLDQAIYSNAAAYPRLPLLRKMGILGGVGIPIIAEGTVQIVLEFWHTRPLLNEANLVGLMTNLSELIGTMMERNFAQRSLAASVKRLEESNEALNDFAYIASHDLKEPLRGIQYNATFLEEDHAEILPEGARSRILRITQLSNRLEALVSDLLSYSRLGRVDLAYSRVCLNALVGDVCDTLADYLQQEGAEITTDPLPEVWCDTVRVTEVLRNLIVNAVKYNEQPSKAIHIGLLDCDLPTFFVRDNGIGIEPPLQEEVFRLFKRLNAPAKFGEGTGAGLTLVKKIIERHGGRIWLESKPGAGSTFYFTLQEAA